MKKTHKIFYYFLMILIVGGLTNSEAQIEDLVERYAGENAGGYIEPLITGFGANLNSGLYRNAKVPQVGLHINIAINGMASIFSDNQKTFKANTTGYFYPAQEVETSTIVGNPEGSIVTSPSGTEFVFPGGYDLKSFLIAVPTLTVGSIMGTEASLRYFNVTLDEEIGKLSLVGIGARHSISQYIPLSPVDIAAGVFYHKFKIGDIVDSDGLSIHAEAGKSFRIINIYGGMAFESNKAKVDYTFNSGVETADVSIDVTGKNKFRATVGFGINLTLLHFNIDYNLGHQNVINAGISIGL